jgi:hypothetical protein
LSLQSTRGRHHTNRSRPPKVWVLLQPTLKVSVPLLHGGEGDKVLARLGPHVRVRHCKARRVVEEALDHLLGELYKGRDRRGLGLGVGGHALQLNKRLHGDAELRVLRDRGQHRRRGGGDAAAAETNCKF